MRKGIVALAVLVAFVLAAALTTVSAQNKSADKGIQKITMKAKIGYKDRMGGYIITGENPPSEILIVNPDKKILEKLMKSNKVVTIKGYFTMGADHLFIEQINGKKYSGKAP